MNHPVSLVGTFVLSLFVFAHTRAQFFVYPKLPPEVRVAADIVPADWGILDFQSGDLNLDTHKDFVLVLEYRVPVMVPKYGSGPADSVWAKPRMLVVLLRQSHTNTFRLAEQNNSFILLHDTPGRQDPFQSVKIADGLLHVHFTLLYDDADRPVTTTVYGFRCRNNGFALVQAETGFINRTTLDFKTYVYDFEKMTGTLTQGNGAHKEQTVTERLVLGDPDVPTLRKMRRPYLWEVTEGVYL